MTLSRNELEHFTAFEKSGWENAADAYHHHWGELSQQSIASMLDAAGVAAGSRTLDLATGAGYAAAAASERGAVATGIDFSKAQVELARKVYPGIEFQEGNAEDIQFEANTFDAVVMGFGINHLPHPEAAFSEAYRVLKPGGRFAFTVWAAPETQTGFGIVLSAIERFGAPQAVLPPAPPYFRFADGAEAKRMFEQTGFIRPETDVVPQYWTHESPDHVFDAFNKGAVRATEMLRIQPEAARQKIRSVVRDNVSELRVGDRYVIPVPAALSSAQKP